MKSQPLYHSTEPGSALRPPPTKARSVLRPLILSGLSALAIFLSATAGVRASPIVIGTQGFNAAGSIITINTGNVTTGTIFNFAHLGTTSNQTGIFTGLTTQTFGKDTLNVTSATGFDFGNSVFGDFSSTKITTLFRGASTADFLVEGMWTPGTFSGFSGVTGPHAAEFALSFTQVGGTGTAPSFSGTIAISQLSAVPEPSSIVMVLTGLIAGVVMFGLHRSRFNLVRG